jgi:hypothetical protein
LSRQRQRLRCGAVFSGSGLHSSYIGEARAELKAKLWMVCSGASIERPRGVGRRVRRRRHPPTSKERA